MAKQDRQRRMEEFIEIRMYNYLKHGRSPIDDLRPRRLADVPVETRRKNAAKMQQSNRVDRREKCACGSQMMVVDGKCWRCRKS